MLDVVVGLMVVIVIVFGFIFVRSAFFTINVVNRVVFVFFNSLFIIFRFFIFSVIFFCLLYFYFFISIGDWFCVVIVVLIVACFVCVVNFFVFIVTFFRISSVILCFLFFVLMFFLILLFVFLLFIFMIIGIEFNLFIVFFLIFARRFAFRSRRRSSSRVVIIFFIFFIVIVVIVYVFVRKLSEKCFNCGWLLRNVMSGMVCVSEWLCVWWCVVGVGGFCVMCLMVLGVLLSVWFIVWCVVGVSLVWDMMCVWWWWCEVVWCGVRLVRRRRRANERVGRAVRFWIGVIFECWGGEFSVLII